MIKNRAAALAVIIAVYVIAVLGGIAAYNFFSDSEGLALSYPLALFLADAAATIIVFIFSLIFGNASVYDPYWSVQPPVILAVALAKAGTGTMCWLVFAAVLFF